jgi:tripeptide aminopeptidase
MNEIDALSRRPAVRAAMAGFQDNLEYILDQIISIQQIPAPTFAEERRAIYIRDRFHDLGLSDVILDPLNNVYGRIPGKARGSSAPLIISAHLDTVFLADTDLSIWRDNGLIYGPGIGDNSTGLAGLLILAETLVHKQLGTSRDIWLVANAGEEGLGDLCGMKAVVNRFADNAIYLVLEGGLYGQLTHQAVGVQRFRIEVNAPGGHSWGGFGSPSAIHVLGHLIVAIDNLKVPESPKTTFNVGKVEGGLSINSIAPSAHLYLDLRSEDSGELNRLVEKVNDIVCDLSERYEREGSEVRIVMETVGNRPAGAINRNAPIVMLAETALRKVGCDQVRYIISSTDANIPLSLGYQAVCLGLTRSGNSHRLDEYIEIGHLPAGLGQLLLVTLAMAGS